MAVTPWQKFILTPRTVLTNTVQSVRTGPSAVWGWTLHNPNATEAWVQFFNLASGSVTLGTTAPDFTLKVPGNGEAIIGTENGPYFAFNTALSWAATTTETGSAALGAALSAYLNYI